ncbi:hypothetical protein EN786_33155 [Mesorhizobium sp. M4B.F.Ca.ET.143.01.1.1]|nr:hypothetical protein EOA31_07025 [Mesorhizobium sp. M4B.F.Ca.ET.049.02.1.2]TGV18541.1 hypothetical protein EN786_33155 [Mesorhizobium sp. M4B.F.Ca.ET.143.01.1.1]
MPARAPAEPSSAGAAPHPPAGTFSPYSDGEKGAAAIFPPILRRRLAKSATGASLSPSLYGERMPVSEPDR